MTETVSVIIPAFNNRETLVELCERIKRTVERGGRMLELILVDDCSRDDSWHVIADIMRTSPTRVVAVQTPHNLGQHRAILVGLQRARGEWCAVLDADLQDAPEAIATLLAAGEYDVVFAGRRGRHQRFVRLWTGRLYRLLLGVLSGLPADVGTFCVLRRDAVDRILALPVTTVSFIAMIGLARLRVKSIPVQREQRKAGQSAYSTGLRLCLAWRMVRCVLEFRFRPAGRAIGLTIEELSAASLIRESAGAGSVAVNPGERQ